MTTHEMSRRTLLKGGAAAAGLSVLQVSGPAQAFPGRSGDRVVPWLDQPPPVPPEAAGVILRQLVWEDLDSWITPNDEFFIIQHYPRPDVDAATFRLDIGGLVRRSQSLSVADLRARRRRQVAFTMECSGNSGPPFFTGGVGNAIWAGTPLRAVLERAGVREEAIEVVFFGADAGEETIDDNGGAPGLKVVEHFARSMSIEEALDPEILLCYEMNREPLPHEHGGPLRLIAPGWYGVANVKWLNRIELRDQRWAGRFMARDYVTIREEDLGGELVWTFNTVRHDRLKSAPAKVVRNGGRYRVIGAAWGAPIAAVEVQIDGGPWMEARLERGPNITPIRIEKGFEWVFWSLDWGQPTAGEHTIRSRAFDFEGNVQPTPEDPYLTRKVTYWESNGQITRRVRVP